MGAPRSFRGRHGSCHDSFPFNLRLPDLRIQPWQHAALAMVRSITSMQEVDVPRSDGNECPTQSWHGLVSDQDGARKARSARSLRATLDLGGQGVFSHISAARRKLVVGRSLCKPSAFGALFAMRATAHNSPVLPGNVFLASKFGSRAKRHQQMLLHVWMKPSGRISQELL